MKMLPWYNIKSFHADCGTLKIEAHVRKTLWNVLAAISPTLKSQIRSHLGMDVIDPYPGRIKLQ